MSATFHVYPTFDGIHHAAPGWSTPAPSVQHAAANAMPLVPATFVQPAVAARSRRRMRSDGVFGFVISTGVLVVALAFAAAFVATQG